MSGCARLREERDALRLRLAEVERERDFAIHDLNQARLDANDANRKRAAVERERDEALRDEGMAVVKYANAVAERDDARRVAKRLAQNIYSPMRAVASGDRDTALAYEVEP